jgi:hypothetical protein
MLDLYPVTLQSLFPNLHLIFLIAVYLEMSSMVQSFEISVVSIFFSSVCRTRMANEHLTY